MESPLICRACLAEINNEFISLDSPFNNTKVIDIFNYCTKLKADLDDEFSNSICVPCGESIQTAYGFIKTAIETDQILRGAVIENIKIEEDDKVHLEVEKENINSTKFYYEEYIEEDKDPEIKEEPEGYLSSEKLINIGVVDMYHEEENNSELCFESNDESESIKEIKGDELEDFEVIDKSNQEIICREVDGLDDSEKKPKKTKIEKAKRLYQCDTCEKVFKHMQSRNNHEFFDHKESVERNCKLCSFSTSRLSSWQSHRYRHENPTKKNYLCSFCSKKFSNPKALHMHEDYHHGNKETAAKCQKCGKKFMNKQKLEYHILSRHSNGRNFECPMCPKTFKNDFQLNAHKKLHSERTIDCPECDKKFIRNVDLKVHMRIHTGELPYQCHLCDKRYRIKVRLTYHMQKHLGTKHICELCSAELNSKSKLRLHMFEHIGMPYVCDECHMGFVTRTGLRSHAKSIHGIILSDEDLLQNRLKNEKNMKKGMVNENDLFYTTKEESED